MGSLVRIQYNPQRPLAKPLPIQGEVFFEQLVKRIPPKAGGAMVRIHFKYITSWHKIRDLITTPYFLSLNLLTKAVSYE